MHSKKRVLEEDDSSVEPVEASQSAPKKSKHLQIALSNQPKMDPRYRKGSVRRIKLHNFLTYDDTEFFPGPYLNVIIGPNGTGKSSIVCALALGLAAKTSVKPKNTLNENKFIWIYFPICF